jgi:hypothetical protein
MPSVIQELASVAAFSILAGSAVTNSDGASTVINGGAIGSYPTNTITAGTPAWTLTGGAAVVVATAANKTDLANAIVYFQGLTSTVLLGGYSTTTFTATPTGYAGGPGFVGAASSSLLFSGGTVTLDGAGLSNPTFVITAVSTIGFTTAATTINLINGATAQNVVFLAGSSLTADAHNHVLQGNLISAVTTTLNASTLSTLNGRALANTGAVTISNPVAFTLPAGSPVFGASATATTSIYGYPKGVTNDQRNQTIRGTIAVSSGTYPPAVGSPAVVVGIPLSWTMEPIKALAVNVNGVIGPFPVDVVIKSVALPPSGYFYFWDAVDGDLHIYQTSASGGPLVEITGSVPSAVVADTIQFTAIFNRN